jgi:hypothetical protein
MKGILKFPLIVAAVFIVLRLVTEQMGAPNVVNNAISVVLLYMLLFPLYFAYRISQSDVSRPYLTHIKLTVLYAVLCRLMIAPTYWLAYALNWTNVPRFTVQGGGVVGGDLPRAIITPFVLLLMWTAGATVVGGGIGVVVIALLRKTKPPHLR